MRIFIDRDHNAIEFADRIVASLAATNDIVYLQSPIETPYPVIANNLANLVVANHNSLGILLCKTGIGMSIVANKTTGVYADNCTTIRECRSFKRYNWGNVLCIGSNILTYDRAIRICEVFIKTKYDFKRKERIGLVQRIEGHHE